MHEVQMFKECRQHELSRIACPRACRLILFLLVLPGSLSWAAVHYVTPTGDAGGLTPAYAVIQNAIDAAAPGDEIRIATGVYDQVTSFSGTAQVARINKPLALRGGYSLDFTQCEPSVFPATIDALGQGRGILIVDESGSPNYQGKGDSYPEVVISGLNVIRGNGSAGGSAPGTSGGNSFPDTGGGICVEWASLILLDCALTSNTASTSQLQQWCGGGALAVHYSNLTAARCRFQYNNGGQGAGSCQGGAIYAQGYNTNVRIEDSAFDNNLITGDGSAVYASQGNIYLRGNSFTGNSSSGRGTVCLEHFYQQWPVGAPPITIRENQFSNNTAGRGGAIYLESPAARIFRNIFQANHATVDGGGAISAVQSNYENYPSVDDTERLTIDNNVFLDNVWTGLDEIGTRRGGDAILLAPADLTGPVYYYPYPGYAENSVYIRHNTFNRPGTPGGTAAINLVWRKANLINNIIANHNVGVRVLTIDTGTSPAYTSQFTLDHTLFSGNAQNIELANGSAVENQSLDVPSPDLDADGFHLLANSPALDAGAATSVNIDYDANFRPGGSAPDIGADEAPLAHEIPPQIVRLLMASRAPYVWREEQQGGGVVYRLLQEYISVVANDMTSRSLETYQLDQHLDSVLTPDHQFTWPAMSYQQNGSDLVWQSQLPLPSQDHQYINVLATATNWTPGEILATTATLTYTSTGGSSETLTAQTSSTLPFVIPIIISPGNGEILPPLPGEAGIPVRGLARPGATIQLYENDTAATMATADANGIFETTFSPNNLSAGETVLTARDISLAGNPSPPSTPVILKPAIHNWCPQRSYWELQYNVRGQLRTFIYHFRNGRGEFATQDWILSRLGGPIVGGTLHLYAYCTDSSSLPAGVTLDIGNVHYDSTQSSAAPPIYQFTTGAMTAGDLIKILVDCGGAPDISIGRVPTILIDPDGYVFDSALGFDSQNPALHTLPGATVTCMQWVPEWGGWVRWPAELYDNQVNPQITGGDGYFAFFTPPGNYYLRVEKSPDYQNWRSPVLEVINEIVHQNVPLTPAAADVAATVTLSPGQTGPISPVSVEVGQAVEWIASAQGLTAFALAGYGTTPAIRVESQTDTHTSQGWDGGMQGPGGTYRRKFTALGIYTYMDGLGRTGTVNVVAQTPVELSVFSVE